MEFSLRCIDAKEAELILLFFKIDCVKLLSPSLDYIEKQPAWRTKRHRMIGYADFSQIISFYKYEYKDHEEIFWRNFCHIGLIEDKKLPLIMSKVNLPYFWLDYVTDVDFHFEIIENKLIVHNDVFKIDDIHGKVLSLICLMLFISDYSLDNGVVDVSCAWDKIIKDAENVNQLIPKENR